MNVLFLGGTSFVGRHIAEAAIRAGNTVSFFNRGMTNASLFPDQRHLVGNRDGDLAALATAEADVVIDTSGFTPRAVSASAAAVANRVKKYVFVSSVDAYDLSVASIDESSPTKKLEENQTTSERVPELYGAHKARCESDLVDLLGPTRVLSIRAGLMVGPHDSTDRFTYWPARIARGGEVLVPVGPGMPVQLIDVRDVADWILGALARDLHGAFNLVGTPRLLDFGKVLDACIAVAGTQPQLTWVSSQFLEANEVAPWVQLPLWLPPDPELAGLFDVSNGRAVATGLRIRPLSETVTDTLAEYRSRSADRELRAGLKPDFESLLLETWHIGQAIDRRK
jgi:2'-hydroxyisoflavone reductase